MCSKKELFLKRGEKVDIDGTLSTRSGYIGFKFSKVARKKKPEAQVTTFCFPIGNNVRIALIRIFVDNYNISGSLFPPPYLSPDAQLR